MSQRPKAKPIVGIVGGIGSGKSLVANQLESLGCAVIRADELARHAINEPQVLEQLTQWWGQEILDNEGRIDRPKVAERVFGNVAELERLEALIHPKVNEQRMRLHQRYQSDPSIKAIVEDTPLLMEKQLDGGCDFIIFVQADRDTRLRRIAASRGWTAHQLDQREKSQIGVDKKANRADYVVDNNAGIDQCLEDVRRVLSQILQEDIPDKRGAG